MAKKQAQAIAIKLSKQRRSGKTVPPPPKGKYPERTRKKAIRDNQVGRKRKAKRGGKKKSGG
jgi:hypothetical protein